MPVLQDAGVSANPSVKQSRIIRAGRQAVYDAWTRPEIFRQWYGPPDWAVTDLEMDPRVGGIFRFTVEPLPNTVVPPGAPRSFSRAGTFTQLVPGERLQITDASTISGESVLTVSFRDVQGGTEVTILHEKLPSESAPLYDVGWVLTLNKLEALLAA
jgi:uncharacterized protein YndB with AHSA1/START domain